LRAPLREERLGEDHHAEARLGEPAVDLLGKPATPRTSCRLIEAAMLRMSAWTADAWASC
jgi:hypothetical protein